MVRVVAVVKEVELNRAACTLREAFKECNEINAENVLDALERLGTTALDECVGATFKRDLRQRTCFIHYAVGEAV